MGEWILGVGKNIELVFFELYLTNKGDAENAGVMAGRRE